jgi:hypothetical protein
LLRQGYFDPNVVPARLPLPRLLIQILDNLNKAAFMAVSPAEIGQRLAAAVAFDPGSRVALEQAEACAVRFRQYCLERNLLDFSLRVDTFRQYLWPEPEIRSSLTNRYRHLIVDNLEEENPFTHAILSDWLPETESALLVCDEDAGYRLFLGASWQTAEALQERCDETVRLDESRVASPEMVALGERLSQAVYQTTSALQPGSPSPALPPAGTADPRPAMFFQQERFYPQMVEWAIGRAAALLAEGVPPDEIVVLAPIVSDALHFSFLNGMARAGLPARSYRPSLLFSDEPAAQLMLVLAHLAFSEWSLPPEPYDVTLALSQAIADLDLVRANLLTQVVYRPYEREQGYLTSFEQIEGAIRDRISEPAGERFDTLRAWLQTIRAGSPGEPTLDQFWQSLFDEILAQPGFGFYRQPEGRQVVLNLIDSVRRFRQVAGQVSENGADAPLPGVAELNRAYLETIERGLLTAQYEPDRETDPDAAPAVLLAPVTTFLMSHRPVAYQIWLDTGSHRWWEHISQPLTHPYVLSPAWEAGRPWTDADEIASQRDRLIGLILGLTRRCRKQIIMTDAEIGEQGYEQRGQLLIALQVMMRQLSRTKTG